MRAREIIKKPGVNDLKTYLVKLRLPGAGTTVHMDTTVQARTPEMARRMIRNQYGTRSVLVGQPRLLK